ncbi:MAG: amidohydrolase family protein, partial [Promethearchaeota archaeon]
LASINKAATSRTGLSDLDREYTLEEIAWITRAGTAQCLGLTQKGHLGVGADGDVAIYRINPNEKNGKKIEDAFSDAAYTIKAGEVVARDGEIVKTFLGNTIYSDVTAKIKPDMLDSVIDDVRAVWDSRYSITFGNYAVQDVYVENPVKVTSQK